LVVLIFVYAAAIALASQPLVRSAGGHLSAAAVDAV
jgi:hypothetical protein